MLVSFISLLELYKTSHLAFLLPCLSSYILYFFFKHPLQDIISKKKRISYYTSVPNSQRLPITLKYNTELSSSSRFLFQLHSQWLFCLVAVLLPHGSSDPQQWFCLLPFLLPNMLSKIYFEIRTLILLLLCSGRLACGPSLISATAVTDSSQEPTLALCCVSITRGALLARGQAHGEYRLRASLSLGNPQLAI